MLFLRRSLTGLFLLAATLALLALAAQTIAAAIEKRRAGPDRPPAARERIYAVNVVVPVAETVAPVLETFGEIRSRRTLELRAPTGGRVLELAPGMADGAAVTAGQVLVRMDPADALAARDLARADLARHEADLRDARRTLALAADEVAAAEAQAALRAQALERQRSLAQRGVGAEAATEQAQLALAQAEQAVLSRRQALTQAEARVEQAEALVARQRITLAEAERRLAETEVVAAFDGTLAEVTVVAGGIVTANERLARLIDPDALEVAFRLSTSQYARLIDAEGDLIPAEVEVALDVLGLELTTRGRLARVSGTVGEGQTGRLVYAALAGARGFRPGDFVAVRVAEPPLADVARLPARAVDAADTVLVVGAGDRLEAVPVEVLRRQGESVLVRAAAVEGRAVVAERAPMLGAGIRVRPVRPAPAEAAADGSGAGMVALAPERRARLLAYVEGNPRLPLEVKERLVSQLSAELVPAHVVERIEAQIGS